MNVQEDVLAWECSLPLRIKNAALRLKAIRNSDIFVSLFFTKVGKYTEEEFDVAHSQFKASGKPRIYTYFKNAAINMGNVREEDFTSLVAFKKKLAALGDYPTSY